MFFWLTLHEHTFTKLPCSLQKLDLAVCPPDGFDASASLQVSLGHLSHLVDLKLCWSELNLKGFAHVGLPQHLTSLDCLGSMAASLPQSLDSISFWDPGCNPSLVQQLPSLHSLRRLELRMFTTAGDSAWRTRLEPLLAALQVVTHIYLS